jgi:hypothetical protein
VLVAGALDRPLAQSAKERSGGEAVTSRRAAAPDAAEASRQATAIVKALERSHDPSCPCHATVKAGHGLTHCPGHKDEHPSFTVTVRNGKVLIKCRAGCSQDVAIAALKQKGLWGSQPTTVYEIRDFDGALIAEHGRWDFADRPKQLKWRLPGGTFEAGLNGSVATADMLYGAELLSQRPDEAVAIVEGEKPANALRSVGILALGTVGGAEVVPSLKVLHPLAERRVVLWPDNDAPGRKHMDAIGRELVRRGNKPCMVVWKDAQPKGDAADFVAASNGDRESARALLNAAVPWKPAASVEVASSWAPIDMVALLAGDLSPLEPTCMVRSDGQPMLYPGRVHDFHGEPETGKSWAAQLAVAEVLNAGGRALYLDFDGEARDVVGHLRALGVSDEHIRDGLLYVRPDEAMGDAIPSDLSVPVQTGALGASVIDGVNNAMATSGLEPNSNLDVRKWQDRLVRPIQLATEGPTILIDHVAKNKDIRGDWPVGAGQKKSGIDGASFYFELIRTFGRGRTGEAKIVVHKDRPGALRGRQGAGKVIAIMRLTSHEGDDHVEAELMPPLYAEDTDQPDGKKRLTGYMQRISEWLEKASEPVSQRAVEDGVPGTASYKRKALSDLVDDGYVERTKGPGKTKTKLHRSIKQYRNPHKAPDDPPADWKPGHDLGSDNEQVGTRVPTAAALRESAERLAAKVRS